MNIGFSNLIARSISEAQLQRLISVSDCFDWAPSLTNPKWNLIDKYGNQSVDLPVRISAIQSLFFGIEGLHFMKSDAEFQIMLNHLKLTAKLADVYGATFVLWGSPDTGNVNLTDVSDKVLEKRMRDIYNLFTNSSASFLIEAISPKFGCKFINSSIDLVEWTESFSTYDLGLHLDTGQMIDEGLDVLRFIESNLPKMKHIHLSEPNYCYSGKYNGFFSDVISLLNDNNYTGDVVLEVQQVEQTRINELISFYSMLKS